MITDHFAKFSEALATKNQTAKTPDEASGLFLLIYGISKILHSDQNTNFESERIMYTNEYIENENNTRNETEMCNC